MFNKGVGFEGLLKNCGEKLEVSLVNLGVLKGAVDNLLPSVTVVRLFNGWVILVIIL
jgi:hypothetical protein